MQTASSALLSNLFSQNQRSQEVQVVASQYLIASVLIDAVRRFHHAFPEIYDRLGARTEHEHEIEEALLDSPELLFGLATRVIVSESGDWI